MKLITTIVLIIASFQLYSQDTISTKQVNQYIGKAVVLKGKIVNIKDYTTQKGNKMIFLDIDEKYPNNLISIAIYEEVVAQIQPEIHTFLNRNILITGTITMYRQIPSIELRKSDFIKLTD